jgi:hypothetical protein
VASRSATRSTDWYRFSLNCATVPVAQG